MKNLLPFLILFLCFSCGGDDEIDFSQYYDKWNLDGTCVCNQGINSFDFINVESDWFIEFSSDKSYHQSHETESYGKYVLTGTSDGQIKGTLRPDTGQSTNFSIQYNSENSIVIRYDIGDEGLVFRYSKESVL